MIGFARAALRATGFACWTIAMLALYGVGELANKSLRGRAAILWHRGVRAIAGLHYRIERAAAVGPRVIYVANHVSYLDIMLLGGLPIASFAAKSDVAQLPVMGWLATLQDTVFVERRDVRSADQWDELAFRLKHSGNLIISPEGTSSDGRSVLPFRSALFDVAYACDEIRLQPISLA